MPPLRIDVRIGPGGSVVCRRRTRTTSTSAIRLIPDGRPHNLYAPFYQALIPALAAAARRYTSGVCRVVHEQLPGLARPDFYDYWDIAVGERTIRSVAASSAATQLGDTSPRRPATTTSAVYTDEHGEAFVAFNPNTGFNFAVDSNFRCDLDLAGRTAPSRASITAQGIYPDQPVIWDQGEQDLEHADEDGSTSRPARRSAACPKGFNEIVLRRDDAGHPGSARPVARRVRFSRTPLGLIQPDAALHGGFDTRGQTLVQNNGPLWVDIRTNSLGQAGVLVTESLQHLRRRHGREHRHHVDRPEPGREADLSSTRRPAAPLPALVAALRAAAAARGTGGGGTGGGGSGTTTTGVQSAASVVSLGGDPTPGAEPKAKAAAKAAAAKLRRPSCSRQGQPLPGA